MLTARAARSCNIIQIAEEVKFREKNFGGPAAQQMKK
jgi:hypothetical protein